MVVTRMKIFPVILFLGAAAILAGSLPADLIARYRFDDGDLADDETGSHPLRRVQTERTAGMALNEGGWASFTGAGQKPAFLETEGPGGASEFTISFWFRTSTPKPAKPLGLLSNNRSATEDYSWEILLTEEGLRVVGSEEMNLLAPGGAVPADTWIHVLLRKRQNPGKERDDSLTSSVEFRVTPLGTESPAAPVTRAVNPGGLQMFRLGINRDSDAPASMDLYDVRVYDDAEVAPAELYARNPESPAVVSFEADKPTVEAGTPLTLTWKVRNAGTVHVAPFPGDVSARTRNGEGSVSVVPFQNGVFTLEAKRKGYPSESESLRIRVVPPSGNRLP